MTTLYARPMLEAIGESFFIFVILLVFLFAGEPLLHHLGLRALIG